MIRRALRFVFFNLIVRPIVYFYLGINARHRERLPRSGPAIVVANHNSHLDALVILVLFGRRVSRKLRPVAAADYFLRNRFLSWFSRNIIGIIPLNRKPGKGVRDPLEECSSALASGDILILFPEGSRGEPERLSPFKSGIAHLAERHPDVPVFPIFLHGLGKALPRGHFVLVPFQCDAIVGESFQWPGSREQFMAALQTSMEALAAEGSFPGWE